MFLNRNILFEQMLFIFIYCNILQVEVPEVAFHIYIFVKQMFFYLDLDLYLQYFAGLCARGGLAGVEEGGVEEGGRQHQEEARPREHQVRIVLGTR